MKRLIRPAVVAVLAVAALLPAAPGARADMDVQRVVTPLGLEAWLVENDSIPVISIEFAFRGGSLADPEGKEGLANLVTYLLDEGAGDIESREFQGRLNDLAISLSFDVGVDAFYGSFRTTTLHAEEAFDLLRLAVTEPRFDPDPVERMRAAVMTDMRWTVADPGWMSRRAFFAEAFAGHPLSRPSRGTAATLQSITIDDLRTFVGDRFTRDHLVIGVSGDIDAEHLAVVLDEVFGGLPETSDEAPVAAPEMPDFGQNILVERTSPQSTMLVAQQGVDRDDPDYYAAIVMNQILGANTLGSRLGLELRERRGLTYGITSWLMETDLVDMLMVGGQLSNENVPEALTQLRAVWAGMAEGGVTEDELKDAVSYLTGSFPLQLTSTGGIAGTLVWAQLEGLGTDFAADRTQRLEAVTMEQVSALAARMLAPDALTVVVVGDPPDAFTADIVLNALDMAASELADGGG